MNSAPMRRNQNLSRNKITFEAGPLFATAMILVLIVLLSVLYLSQVTKTSVFNYKISNLQNKQTKLETEKQKLQIEAARVQTLAQAKTSGDSAGLVRTTTVSFATAK